jgi:uncharacterized protein DUF5916/cellulose/xylan binding protein with CBM9 domain
MPMHPLPVRASCSVIIVFASAVAAQSQQPLAVPSIDGRKHVTAVWTDRPVIVDGVLDEAVWTQAPPATGFVQADPNEGQPATEQTEVRVAFDAANLYIAALCRDSQASGIVVNTIRKDFADRDQDMFEVLLDTFADRRNGFVFVTNAAGARADTQMANEGREVNPSWDAVWWVNARTTADGWTAEFRIPFNTLRFRGGDARIWGINFARRVRRKNEVSYWSPVTRAFTIYRASLEGDLAGLPPLRTGRNLRIKPFVLGGAVRGDGERRFARDLSGGLDVKVGVSPSLTLDITAKPDFAQAEADEQQVNLTQFSLFFPEKREFFLENSGIFYFGDIPRNARNPSRFRPPEEDLLLFFSRRIGLGDDGRQEPLYGGARMTGRAGGFLIGAMTMQSERHAGKPGTNYTVARVRRELFGSSDVGAIVLSREPAGGVADFNRVAGVDANFRFFRGLSINGFGARSSTPGTAGNQNAGKASIGWEDSLKRLQTSIMTTGEGFRDDVGFVRRVGVTRQFYDGAWFLRPAWLNERGMRQFEPHARAFLYRNPAGELVSKTVHAGGQLTWNNGAFVEYAFEPRREAIVKPFAIHPRATIPVGGYDWNQHLFVYESDHSRALSGSLRATLGDFWSGTQRTAQVSLLYRPSYRLSFDLGSQVSDIHLDLPRASFITTVTSLRTGYSFSRMMFLDALVQYRNDVRQLSANVRFNLIHRPLSDLFVVYNESQFENLEQAAGRGVVVKYTHMLAF